MKIQKPITDKVQILLRKTEINGQTVFWLVDGQHRMVLRGTKWN